MIWVGSTMAHGYGQTDPALVNPRLPVDMRRPDWDAASVGYWPSYTDITSRQRAAYLSWLAHGRRAPGVPICYVFLFFYGLERRVLDAIDMRAAQTADGLAELATIRAEIKALRDVYTGQPADDHAVSSFDRYSSSLLDIIDAISAATTPGMPPVPGYGPEVWEMPLALKVALGRMARDGVALPADWALAWAWLHPKIYARTPQRRCRTEFDTLFALRYAARHGPGLRLRAVRQELKLDNHGASIISRSKPITVDGIPDVSDQERPIQTLTALVDEINNDLDAFSRWVGRHPDDVSSLAALSTLPADLVAIATSPALKRLMDWIASAVEGRTSAVADSRPLLDLWGGTKFGKADAVAMVNPDGVSGGSIL